MLPENRRIIQVKFDNKTIGAVSEWDAVDAIVRLLSMGDAKIMTRFDYKIVYTGG